MTDRRREGWRRLSLAAVTVAAGVFATGCARCQADAPDGADGAGGAGPGASAGSRAVLGELQTRNSAGRSGTFFLPPGREGRALPAMVAFHGTGADGRQMVQAFRALASARGFVIVAPASRRGPDGQFNWQVGDQPGDRTEDYTHALACLAEVRAMDGVRLDDARILAVGYSGGGSSAAWLASNEPLFGAFAVLHGGVFPGGLGSNVVAAWFSTGEADSLRSPGHVQESVRAVRSRGFDDVTYRAFPGGHALEAVEVRAMVAWWLGQ